MADLSDYEQQASSGVLIAGLGNLLLMDDGVGVHAVRALLADPIEGALVVEVGTAVFDALRLVEAARTVIALDAVQAGGAPGTIYEMQPDLSRGTKIETSLHELDLRSLFEFLPMEDRPELIVLGVEPERIEAGLELSKTVRAVLPEFVSLVRRVAAGLYPMSDLADEEAR